MDFALFERILTHIGKKVCCKLTGRIIQKQDLESLEGNWSAFQFLTCKDI